MWPKPYLRQGCEEGISLSREEGIVQQRMLLRRLAAARFGAAMADRLANALAAEANPERLAEVGEEIVRCTTGDELLRKIGVSTLAAECLLILLSGASAPVPPCFYLHDHLHDLRRPALRQPARVLGVDPVRLHGCALLASFRLPLTP